MHRLLCISEYIYVCVHVRVHVRVRVQMHMTTGAFLDWQKYYLTQRPASVCYVVCTRKVWLCNIMPQCGLVRRV